MTPQNEGSVFYSISLWRILVNKSITYESVFRQWKVSIPYCFSAIHNSFRAILQPLYHAD